MYITRNGFGAQHTQSAYNVTIYRGIATVGWSCVHLPIQYGLRTDLSPNTADTPVNVVGYANDNGLIRLTLSGPITANALDWLFIDSTSLDELDGAFKIITKHSSTQFTINAPYSLASLSPYTYSSATAVKYYNNMYFVVRVYAGIPSGYFTEPLKPYELITELKMSPDANGDISFNIAEAVKEKLEIQQNRPNYDSYPYDLDRYAAFYIEYTEQYDESDGVTVTSTNTGFFASGFVGFAADAKLAFKNRYAGFLSEYVYGNNSNTLKFLSDGVPTLFSGYYFDISYIHTFSTIASLMTINYDATGVQIGFTEVQLAAGPDEGIVRLEIAVTGSEAYKTIQILNVSTGLPMSELKRINVNSECANVTFYVTWKNHLGGFNYWLFTSNKDYGVNILDTKQSDKNYFTEWPNSYAETADTITQETYRSSVNELTLRAENLSEDDADFIAGIRTSSLVQIMTTKYDRRTILVEASSFKKRTDNEKLVSIEFTVRYTDNIPSQSL